ncbi:hypothetical protein R75461_07678 [Paraburkholderia nemoris]|uniref:hypothetical protein n=1 Tax=Paraburkholderia nemoris TaxID=2793076 RepID=UPI00190D488A|nr:MULTISPECIES: hypothetical protein [Paraburkholderia]MBK3786440.1 hypothetical protein [Paraburkholderia aspalathi]CAE6855336.1 hypothetical protein R75461_07678 [Paraburkholderia nemoris]
MAYNSSTTYGELMQLVTKILAENDVFKIGKRRIAKIFLRNLLDLDNEVGYAQVEAAYRVSTPRDDVPEGAEDFWLFIEKDYLNLEVEPREKFTELSIRVSEDLAKITGNLKYISQERNFLEEKKRQDGRLSADERYYRNQLDYFENKNIVARDEIVDFMANGIKFHAINKSARNSAVAYPFGFIFGDSPYAFGRSFMGALRDAYDVRSLDEYSNKFTDLPVSGYREVIKDCRQSVEKFKEIALVYINGVPDELPSVRMKLETLVGRSHMLGRRKQIINTLLRHFDAKDYISFVSIAPLQIEGIFADICREIGISESQLDISSLNDKLEHIDGKINSFHYFEYYAFKFPVLRNLVAHGGLVDGDLEKTALHLMLDLLPVCNLTISEELPVNHALKVIDEAGKNKHEKLIEWLDLRESIKIPAFYGASEKISAVEALYASEEFWGYLEKEVKRLDDIDQIKTCEAVKVAGKVKRSGLATEQAEKFLKSSSRIASEAIKERNETLDGLRKYLNPPVRE